VWLLYYEHNLWSCSSLCAVGFIVFAFTAIAELCTSNASLVALAVLLLAIRFSAVASPGMPPLLRLLLHLLIDNFDPFECIRIPEYYLLLCKPPLLRVLDVIVTPLALTFDAANISPCETLAVHLEALRLFAVAGRFTFGFCLRWVQLLLIEKAQGLRLHWRRMLLEWLILRNGAERRGQWVAERSTWRHVYSLWGHSLHRKSWPWILKCDSFAWSWFFYWILLSELTS
jgi:hypothetical protein